MYVTALRTEGLRGGPGALAELTRSVSLPAPPGACAAGDALVLLSAALSPARVSMVGGLGWAPDGLKVVGEGGDLELQGLESAAVAASVEAGAHAVTIEAELLLDPPLYGQLRDQAVRDPRVVTALGQRPSLSVKVGWLLNRDRSVAAPSVLGVRVGDVAFETVGKDRPAWLPNLLEDLGGRFARPQPLEPVDAVALRLLEASLSADPERRAGWRRVVAALQLPPFSLPEPGLVRVADHVQAVFGPDLLRVRQLGRAAWDALRLAEAALLVRPDVLIVDEPVTAPVREWLEALPEADDAPVEQVWAP